MLTRVARRQQRENRLPRDASLDAHGARSDLPANRRTVAYIASWIMPIIGPIDMLVQVSRHARGVEPTTGMAPVPVGEPAPEFIELPGLEPFAVAPNTFNGHDYPILD